MTESGNTGGIPDGAVSARNNGSAGTEGNAAGIVGGNATGTPGPQPPSLPPYAPPPPPSATPPAVVPTDADHALEIGRTLFPREGSPGGPVGLFVHEFDIGYLIYPGYPVHDDPTVPPPCPGGSNAVIAKADGKVTFLPNHPPEDAVELYRLLLSREAP